MTHPVWPSGDGAQNSFKPYYSAEQWEIRHPGPSVRREIISTALENVKKAPSLDLDQAVEDTSGSSQLGSRTICYRVELDELSHRILGEDSGVTNEDFREADDRNSRLPEFACIRLIEITDTGSTQPPLQSYNVQMTTGTVPALMPESSVGKCEQLAQKRSSG